MSEIKNYYYYFICGKHNYILQCVCSVFFVHKLVTFTGDDVMHIVPSDYDDMTYTPAASERPNARDISNLVAKQTQTGRSYSNKTTMFAYFGRLQVLM